MMVFLYPIVMKQKKLPFTIGEQYELFEFELIGSETIKIGNYDYDKYGLSESLFNKFKLEGLLDVKLFYNADILAKVEYLFISEIPVSKLKHIIPSKKECITEIKYLEKGLKLTISHTKYFT